MYRAIESRDASFIGAFVVAVKTTRIFCRPGCPARVPLLKNVEFFARGSDALHAGYRPCKRCRPLDPDGTRPKWFSSLLDHVDANTQHRFRDRDLRQLGFEPETIRRCFKKKFGMTFQAYSRARRLGEALSEIRGGKNSVEAAMDAGYASDSAFRDAFQKVFGSTVGSAKTVKTLIAKWIETPIGGMLAIADDDALCLLEFVDRRMLETQIQGIKRRLAAHIVPGDHRILNQIESELIRYFGGELTEFKTPIVYPGSEFQMKVWRRLLQIPYGQTMSYGELAMDIGCPGGSRAVGKANGDNRIAIVIPCHRVIHADGTLCGYGGGLWRKQKLLELENAGGQKSLFDD